MTPDADEPAGPAGDGGLGRVRVRLDLSYDGTDFSGWARQPGRRTVQGSLEDALGTILRIPAPRVTVAGRTDAGVHAIGQVAHVDLPPEVAERSRQPVGDLLRRLAGLLPDDVVVRAVGLAPEGFDARFSAIRRHYRYRVCDRQPDPLRRRDTVRWRRPLDAGLVAAAAAGLLGEHDFAAYCKPRPGATTIRTLLRLTARRGPDDVVVIDAEADAFCHHQVRSIVGALLAVGDGRAPVGWPVDVLRSRLRDGAVTVAPARGLTLVGVEYPTVEQLAAQARAARRRRELRVAQGEVEIRVETPALSVYDDDVQV